MAINEKELKAFITLADQLHYARASQLCHMTPSALSRLITRLELHLDVILFYRDKRSVRLSCEGEMFYQYAKESLVNYKDFQDRLMCNRDTLHGELSIFCSVTATYTILSRILPTFRSQHPSIDVRVHTGDPSIAIQRVIDDEEDIGITAMPIKQDPNLAFKTLAHSDIVLIAPKEGEIAHRLSTHGAQSCPWIISEDGIIRERFDHWEKLQKHSLDVYAQVSGYEAIVSLVALGFGVGLVPALVLRNSPHRHGIMSMKQSVTPIGFDICVCVKRRRLESPLVSAFWSNV
jgi:LysR family transcriptional regulator, positive regulator for ilvC